MATFTKDGLTLIDEGTVMPGTEYTFPITAAADLLLHENYLPYVEDDGQGTDGEETRDGQRVWVHYAVNPTEDADEAADTEESDEVLSTSPDTINITFNE